MFRLSSFIEFIRTFLRYASHVRETIVVLILLLVLGGFTIAAVEDIKLGDAIYFSFITGLSIGYGDIHPETPIGKLVSVTIGLIGVVFVGMTVAVATRALRDTAENLKKAN